MTPTLSVLMPVFNCERYLDEAIRSIRDQTFTDFEFVIVNDGSTDRSLGIIKRHAAEDDRLIVLDRDNGGIVDALNAGLEVCRGEFIARMDADDVALPERFERQVQVMRADPDLVVLGTDAVTLVSSGMMLMKFAVGLDHEGIVSSLLRGQGTAMIHPTVLMRRSAVVEIGGYRKECCWAEDLDIYLRLIDVGKCGNLAQVLLLYRQHDQSITKTSSDRCWHYCCEVLQDTQKRRPDFAGRIEMPGRWRCDPVLMRLGWICEMLAYRQRLAAFWEVLHLSTIKPISRRLWKSWGLVLLSFFSPGWVEKRARGVPRFMGELIEVEEFHRLKSWYAELNADRDLSRIKRSNPITGDLKQPLDRVK